MLTTVSHQHLQLEITEAMDLVIFFIFRLPSGGVISNQHPLTPRETSHYHWIHYVVSTTFAISEDFNDHGDWTAGLQLCKKKKKKNAG